MLKKRNKLGKMLLIIMSASILSSVNVFAEEKSNLNQDVITTANNIKETSASDFDFDATTGTITKYNGSDAEVVIPSKINGVKVTSIGKGAFTTLVGNGGVIPNNDITSVVIPNGVTSIGDNAFTDCVTLTNIVIPNSVTSIGEGAFYKCVKVSNMTIPDSVTSIGHNAFSWGGSVGTLSVESERVKQLLINASAKENKIILKNQSSSQSDFDFDARTGTITKYNGSDAEVVIPSKINGVKVTIIGKGSFTTLVGNGGVISNDYITSVIIPNGVTSIGDYAFTDDGLTNVVIPNSVTSIGEKAFYKCTRLSNMTIPESVTSIGHDAFNGVKLLYVDSERVQLLINASGRTDGIILKNGETVNSNTSTQTSVSSETSNTFKWEKNSDGTWKLTKGGIAQGGWQQVNGKWYLMNSNGIMLTGWQPVNGKWYYLYSSGEMASNTTISGYTLGSDGAWI